MFGLLRTIRAFCGLIFAIQVVGLLSVFTWFQHPTVVTGSMLAMLLIKVITVVVFGGLFFWLRLAINRLHTKRYAMPHPALATKRWAL